MDYPAVHSCVFSYTSVHEYKGSRKDFDSGHGRRHPVRPLHRCNGAYVETYDDKGGVLWIAGRLFASVSSAYGVQVLTSLWV